MKQIYFLAIALLFSINNSNAQTVTIADSGPCMDNITLSLGGTYNGKNYYTNAGAGVSIYWDSTTNRWVNDGASATPGVNAFLIWVSTVNTPLNPPNLTYGSWTDISTFCGSLIQMDGTGTDDGTVLSVSDENLLNDKQEVFPNPANNSISIANLEGINTFKVFNLLGKELLSGKLTGSNTINIQDLTNGIYLLKLNDDKIIKFIKSKK